MITKLKHDNDRSIEFLASLKDQRVIKNILKNDFIRQDQVMVKHLTEKFKKVIASG
jgi:hypothetical protein